MAQKVQYEEMLPHELERIIREAPAAYVPLGSLECHGWHMALGNDEEAVQAFERSLELNPENEHAREMIAELRGEGR